MKTILNLPSEDEIIQAIFDSVDIRGIDLENYRYKFTNKESGLYDRLVALFSKSAGMEFKINVPLVSSNHWNCKFDSVIFVEKFEDVEPLYLALCKQNEHWQFPPYKKIIQVLPENISTISELYNYCTYCGLTDINNIEELRKEFKFIIYQTKNKLCI